MFLLSWFPIESVFLNELMILMFSYIYVFQVSSPKVESFSRTNLKQDFKSLSSYPLYFHWANGRAEKVYVANKDTTLSVNLKKGFVNLFQLQRESGVADEVYHFLFTKFYFILFS